MIQIEEYILLSYEERKGHIDLEDKCIERNGHYNNFRGVLAQYLNTTFPASRKINLCHACNNGKCSNPKHLYWGTAKENSKDYLDAGGKTVIQKMQSKFSEEEMRSIRSKAGKIGGGKANLKTQEHWESYRESFNRIDRTKRGWFGKLAEIHNVSPMCIRRIAKRLEMI